MDRLTWLVEGMASGLPAVAAAAVIVVYGLAGAWLIGVHSNLLRLASALPTAVALIIIAAQLVGMLGISIPIVAHALTGLAIAALLGAAATLMRRSRVGHPSTPVEADRVVWLGVAIGFVVSVAVWTGGIGDFALPPQGHDDIWHGYLVERLTHMPLITAGTVAPVFADDLKPTSFYQYGVHLSVAFAHSITGVTVPEALNGAWAMVMAMAIPAGGAALAWSLFPARKWVAFWAAILAPAVVIFPYLTNGLMP